jgi:invasion protein IalB
MSRAGSLAATLTMVVLTLAPVRYARAQQPSASPAMAATDAGRGPQITPADGQPPVQITFSPWVKYCTNGAAAQVSDDGPRKVCFTAADGHLPSDQKLVIALLIEPEGGGPKSLRVTLPLGVALGPGARIVIDETDAMTAPFFVCLPRNGCMADYSADADLIAKLKKGRSLAIQAFDKGKPISFVLPLTGFESAYVGPASDPVGFDEPR